jgi:hypothetical protein
MSWIFDSFGWRKSGENVPSPEEFDEKVQLITDRILKGLTMHYRNGREAKNGDKVVKLGGYGTPSAGAEIVCFGVLHSAVPGNDHCNGSIAPITNDTGACICDMLHVDDVAEFLKEKGLHERPRGK